MVQFNDVFGGNRALDMRAQEEERYVQAMAPRFGFPYIYLRGYTINPEALLLIPEQTARTVGAVSFDVKQKVVSVAAKNPADPAVIGLIANLTKRKYSTQLYICSTQSLEHVFARYKDVVSTTTERKGVFEISPEDILTMKDTIKVKEDIPALMASIRLG